MSIRSLVVGLMVAAVAASGAWAQTAGPKLSCEYPGQESPEAHESKVLKTSPDARRVSTHVLRIAAKSGIKRFADKKPYREELDGFHWTYCGYLPGLDAHLIGMEQDDLFSGKLFFDRSGRLLDAGHTIYPSPDGKLFLADRQTDGKLLGDWVLSDMSGKSLWSGEAGVVRADGVVLMEYEDPRWDGGVLKAVAVCDDEHAKGVATLVRSGPGWRWRTDVKCKG